MIFNPVRSRPGAAQWPKGILSATPRCRDWCGGQAPTAAMPLLDANPVKERLEEALGANEPFEGDGRIAGITRSANLCAQPAAGSLAKPGLKRALQHRCHGRRNRVGPGALATGVCARMAHLPGGQALTRRFFDVLGGIRFRAVVPSPGLCAGSVPAMHFP
jgi:hypothetical protein